MPRDAAGTFTRDHGAVSGSTAFQQEFNAATNINYQSHDAGLNDIATALTDSLSRSGKGTLLANIDAAGRKFTNVANASANTEWTSLGQVNTLLGSYLPLAGGTMSGNLLMSGAATLQTSRVQANSAGNKGRIDFTNDINIQGVTEGANAGDVNVIATGQFSANVTGNIPISTSAGTITLGATAGSINMTANSAMNFTSNTGNLNFNAQVLGMVLVAGANPTLSMLNQDASIPTTPGSVANWLKIQKNSTTYWVPLYL